MGVVIVEGAVLGVNAGHPIVTNWEFVYRIHSCLTMGVVRR